MIDFAKINVKAGNGGRGAGSFHKIKGKKYGKADGGDGGKGGNVYLVVSTNLNTLESFRFIKHYQAENGQSGASRKRKGAQGVDLEIKVPVGTQVRIGKIGKLSNLENPNTEFSDNLKRRTSEHSEFSDTTYDLVWEDQKILVARGGEGGRGNLRLRDEFGRRPKKGEAGQTGEEAELTLELKLIADVGLIGFPNAGKSTLLAALTSARPEIADYPFTTLEPNLGVLDSSQFVVHSSQKDKKKVVNSELSTNSGSALLVLADIPGLIEGASRGKGLGDLFLRHIERTKMLAHLIDLSGSGDVWGDYQTIRQELKSYSKIFAKKREIVVLSKIDLCEENIVAKWIDFFKSKKKKVLAISAKSGFGIQELVKALS